jgi:hypothetical protein
LSLTAVSIRLPFILILKPDISKGSTCSWMLANRHPRSPW